MQNKTLKLSPAKLFLFALIVIVSAYYVTLADMFTVWWEDASAYSHGLLLAPIALYLFVERWKENRQEIKTGYHFFFILCLVGAGLLWLAAHMVFVQFVEHLAFLAILVALVFSILGFRRARPFLFPILLFSLTVPIWDPVISLLQYLTAVFSAYLVQLSGVHSVREGFQILITSGTFEVVEGCSGLRYQLAGASIGLLYVYMAKMKFATALIFMSLEVATVFLANVGRIYIVILVGDNTNMQSPLIDDHLWLGWLIFAIFIGVFLTVSNRFVPVQAKEVRTGGYSTGASEIRTSHFVYILMLILITIMPPVLAKLYSLESYRDKIIDVSMVDVLDGWSNKQNANYDDWQYEFQQGNGQFTALYEKGPQMLRLDIIHYVFQEQGREAVYFLNRLYDKKTWFEESSEQKQVLPSSTQSGMTVKESILKSRRGKRKMVWMWYFTNNQFFADGKYAKINNLLGILHGSPEISVYITSMDINTSEEEVRMEMSEFAKHLIPEIMNQKNK